MVVLETAKPEGKTTEVVAGVVTGSLKVRVNWRGLVLDQVGKLTEGLILTVGRVRSITMFSALLRELGIWVTGVQLEGGRVIVMVVSVEGVTFIVKFMSDGSSFPFTPGEQVAPLHVNVNALAFT
jgi:hypothetical protein